MKISLTILLLFFLVLGSAQDIEKLNNNECGQLKSLIQKHKSLGRKILNKEDLGSLNKRIYLSKKQYEKAISLLNKSISNECNQPWNKHTDQLQIVDCYLQMEEFDKAQTVLSNLEDGFRYDVYPRGLYGWQFFDYYFSIYNRYSYHEEIRKNGVVYHCGNSFDYKRSPKYQLEQSIEKSKVLRQKKEWKYLVLFLQQVPISLYNNDSELETYYRILNQFLLEGLLNLHEPEVLLLEIEKCGIQTVNLNNYGYFSFNLKNCTHYISLMNYKFGLHLNDKLIISNKSKEDELKNELWLTKGMKNAIYDKQ